MSSSKRIFKIDDGFTVTEVFPLNDSALSYTWEFDEKKIYYVQKLKTKFKFGNNSKTAQNDFDLFYSYFSNPLTTCQKLFFSVYKICEGVETLEWIGEFSTVDGDFDLDRCLFSVKPNDLNVYTCLDKQKNVDANILNVPNVISTSADLIDNFEYFYCAYFSLGCGTLPGPNPTTWMLFYQNLSYPFRVGCTTVGIAIKVYYREYENSSCVAGVPSPPSGTGWLLETNNCGFNSTAKYVRNPLAGAFPFTTQIVNGWYNLALSQDEPPPYPSFVNLNVVNNPPSENLFKKYTTIVGMKCGLCGIDPEWYFEVINNPNSTYIWTLDGSSLINAIVTGVTNVVKVQPLSPFNPSGNIIIKLTETHGNAFVSTKLYTIPFIGIDASNSQIVPQSTVIGPNIVCKDENDIIYIIPDLPTVAPNGFYTPTLSNIVWSVTGGASITSGQGTTAVIINAPPTIGSFNVIATWTCTVVHATTPANNYFFTITNTKSVLVADLPVTDDIVTIINRYPSEPNIVAVLQEKLGASYAWYDTAPPTFLSNGSSFIGFNSYIIATPAIVGTYCYLVKETVNCTCPSWFLIGAGFPIITIPYTGMGFFPPIYWCKGNSINTTTFYTRNRIFFEACEYVLSKTGCSQTQIVSDFFEWNPVGDTAGYVAGINYVTGLTNKLRYITISQKSDVIQPTSSNAATIGMLNFDKITQIWATMFNCYWFIDNLNRVRVEHISWFNKILAFDTTIAPNAIYNVAKRQFTFDKSKMPRFEKFIFGEQRTTDMAGSQIFYNSLCVNQDSKNNTEENNISFVSTDLYFISQSPSEINPQGFVLFCNDFNAGVYTVNVEAGNITGGLGANYHFGWANLHVNYHKYRRVLLQGFMNNVLTNFVTAKRTKQQKDLVLVICCQDNFDASNILIKSELGEGIVDNAEYNVKKGVMVISLLHNNNF
jgi:hypothetical protein